MAATPTLCVLLPAVGMYPALGRMLSDTAPRLGWNVNVAHRATPEVLSADVLLLAGLCRYIEGLREQLSRRDRRKTATILWQLEPLPPVQFSASGEQIGRRVASWDWGRIPLPLRRVLDLIVPFRSRLLRSIRRCLANRYRLEVESGPRQQGWLRFDEENFFNAAADWNWIQDAHSRGWIDFHFASVQPRVEFLRSRGIPANMVAVGYHPGWGRDLKLERDIDVLFLGTLGRGPRRTTLQQLGERLDSRGLKLTVVEKAFGAERERLLNRCKIMLNLLRAPHDLPGMRVLLGLSCGALVLSEQCEGTGAFVAGEHFVMSSLQEMPQTIETFLGEDSKRERIARAGHAFVTSTLTLENSLSTLLQPVTSRA